MKTIAITGGIGSGKSTVTDYLISKGYIVIDADKMAREITAPGGKAIPYILENFGSEFINEDGSMNRVAMRDLVFGDPSKKLLLEKGTTHVVIDDINKIKSEAEKNLVPCMFFDIPLLFENNAQNDYDQIWVITADREIRKERVKKRDGISDNIVELIIGSQTEEDYKIKLADQVIYNNGTKDKLYHLIDSMIKNL